MKEYFIVANSFAAPFVSDQSTEFVEAETPEEALLLFAKQYTHPCGLYAALVYDNANAYHKRDKPLARWLSNHAAFMQGKIGFIRCDTPGKVEINGVLHEIERPKEGSVSDFDN